MAFRDPLRPDVRPSRAGDGEVSTVTLREAAEMLGLTEAAVLMRVIRRSLPSVKDRDGGRRVPREALGAGLERDAQQHVREHDRAPLDAALEACAAELSEARARITALESNARYSPAPLIAGLEALAADLDEARARIAALESNQRRARPWWRRLWELYSGWLNPQAPNSVDTRS
jgi:hypothetical protein